MRAALIALLAACGTSPEECRTYANDLGTLLERAAEEPPSFLAVPDGIKLVERADLSRKREPYGPSIEVNAAAVWFRGNQLTGSELSKALTEDLAKRKLEQERYHLREPIDPQLVYFVIDAKAPWPKVVEAFDAAMFAGMTRIALVFQAPQSLKLPPRAPIDDKLDQILVSTGDRAHEIAEVIQGQIKTCPGIGVAFEAIVSRDSGNKAVQLAKIVPDALVHCACRVNMPDLRSTLFRLLYIEHPLRALQLDPASPADSLMLRADATWADAARRLSPDTRNVEFILDRMDRER